MKQAFDVWYTNKDSILFDVSVGVHHGENYKLARPHQLYHLDMHQLNPSKTQEDENIVSSAIDSESLNGASTGSSSVQHDILPVTQEFLSLSVLNNVDNSPGAQEKSFLKPPNLPHPASAFSGSRVNAVDGLLIQPENIKWIYLDASGNEQGPFAGDVMQEWLGDGYLSPDLKIRRQEQLSFVTLRSFCESINNFILPFKTPLPPVSESSAGPSGLLVGALGAFGDLVAAGMPDAVSAQGTGVSMASSNLFGASQQVSGGIAQTQLQNLFNSKMYPQILPNNGFVGAGLRSLSSNLMFDYNGSKDYSLMNQLFSGGSQFGLDALNQNIGGGFGQLHMPSLLHQQIHGQQPVLSRSNSGWAVDTSIPAQIPQAPVAGAPSSLSIAQSGLGASSMSQPSPMSPWLNRVSSSRAASPFIPATSLSNEDTVLSDIHSSMVTGILNDEEPTVSYFQSRDVIADSNLNSKTEAVANSKATLKVDSFQSSKENTAVTPAVGSTETSAEQKVEGTTVQDRVEPVVKAASQVLEKVQKVIKTVEEPTTSPLVATVLAPWARKSQEPEAPTLSLKEVQRLEAEVSEKERQTKAELQREIALAEAIAASREEKYASASEKVPAFNWAANSQESVTKKTLAEIQKEEEEAARSRALKKAAAGSTPGKSSLASTLASTVSKDDFGGGWTAVTKKPIVKKAALQSVTPVVLYSQLSGGINPQILRSASSQDTVISVNANALKEDFLVWARSAMTNLYPSVSKNDLLEVFTTLPLHGESQQLISETIYSSSATMDGRRFAQEFFKKRQQVERQIGSNAVGSWSAAIASSADKTPVVDDDGWSTSVKSKKKGRK